MIQSIAPLYYMLGAGLSDDVESEQRLEGNQRAGEQHLKKSASGKVPVQSELLLRAGICGKMEN